MMASLATLLAAERPRLLRMARRRLPTPADAEDVVPRAMLRAAENAGALRDPARSCLDCACDAHGRCGPGGAGRPGGQA
jgi:hypothetical protein